MLAGTGTLVRGIDTTALVATLNSAGIEVAPTADGALLTDADSESIGRAAAAGGVVLLELRAADGGGLEDLFLSLTSEAGTR